MIAAMSPAPREVAPPGEESTAAPAADDEEVMMVPQAEPDALLDALRRQVERTRSVSIARYETEEVEVVHRELVPAVRSELEEAIDVLSAFLVEHPPDRPPVGLGDSRDDPHARAFLRRVDGLVVDRQTTDIAFIGRSELRHRLEGLLAVGIVEDKWRLIDICGSALRKVVKVATAIQCVMSPGDPSGGGSSFESELAVSLQVRVAYAKFRRSLWSGFGVRSDPVTEVRRRLQRAATSIATLVGRDVYSQLRIADRVALRALQDLVIGILRAPEGFDEVGGRRLWQDLEGFAELTKQVNHRQDLVQHDRATVSEVMRACRSGGADTAKLRERVESLRGLDDELDELMRGRCGREEISATLMRLSSHNHTRW